MLLSKHMVGPTKWSKDRASIVRGTHGATLTN